MAIELTTVSLLKKQLKPPVILFCGSGISGGIEVGGIKEVFLPMAKILIRTFFLEISKLPSNKYIEDILSKYAFEMINGKYQKETINLKFEDFIWRIQKAFYRRQVNNLLSCLYFCEPNQFTPNHIAIIKLLDDNFSRLCITTNFDNAIKNINPRIVSIVQDKKTRLTEIPKVKTVLKLHGDVVKRKFTATNPDLIDAEQLDRYSYLQELLKNSTILVSGYSGMGDIDISPHLKNAKDFGARFIWLIKKDSEPNEFIEEVASFYFRTNLFSCNRSDNCLLDLAGIDNYLSSYPFSFPDWKSKLQNWILKNHDYSKILNIIDECLVGDAGWAKYHLYTLGRYKENKVIRIFKNQSEEKIYLADRCIEIGTYWTGLCALLNLDSSKIKPKRNFFKYLYLKGFSLWRLMKTSDSLKTLDYFPSTTQRTRIHQFFEKGYKSYFETVRDKLRFICYKKKRQRFWNKNKIPKKISRLKRILKRSKDSSNQILSLLAILDIKKTVGEKVILNDYILLFERAMNLNDWRVAELVACSILRIDRDEGEKCLSKVDKKSDRYKYWHSTKERILARIDFLPCFVIWSIRWIIAKLSVLLRETILIIKKLRWRLFSVTGKIVIE